MRVRVRARVEVWGIFRLGSWLGPGLRGGSAHLDEVVRREEVDSEQHDEMHGDIRTPRRDDL